MWKPAEGDGRERKAVGGSRRRWLALETEKSRRKLMKMTDPARRHQKGRRSGGGE